MLCFNRLAAVVLTAVLIGQMAPVEAKTRKGDRFYAEGKTHEVKREWDAALEAYEKALSEDPAEVVYQIAAQKARMSATRANSAWPCCILKRPMRSIPARPPLSRKSGAPKR